MHGQLTARSATDVCRELAEASSTGVLQITGIDRSGQLFFEQGRLVNASSPTPGSRLGDRLVNGGLLEEETLHRVLEEQTQTPSAERVRLGQLLVDRGLVPFEAVRLVIQEQLLDALFDLARWREGTYRFEADADPEMPEVPLSIPVDQALVEVARRREEWEALSEVIPDLDGVPHFREGSSTANASLEPDEFSVVASVDGHRSVRDLAYDLGYGEFEAARIVYGLCLLGLVEVRRPTDEIGAALDDALQYVGQGTPPEGVPSTDPAAAPAAGTDQLDTDELPADPDPVAVGTDPGQADPQGDPVGRQDDAVGPQDDTVGDEPDPVTADAVGGADPATGDASFDASIFDQAGDLADVAAPAAAEAADAPGAPADPGDDERSVAGADAGDTTLEADLPDFSAFEELRLSDRWEQDAPADEPEPEPEPPASAPAAEPAAWTPRHQPAPGDGDTSEFLRELSRLALDEDDADEPPAAEEPEPPPRPRPTGQREEPKRKKRGLFGFGS